MGLFGVHLRPPPASRPPETEERTFEVDNYSAEPFKREIVRPKFRHRLYRNRAPLLAPEPKRVVMGGFASLRRG